MGSIRTTPTPGISDHGLLSGLGDDDHTQYALLAGRSGGQTLTGDTASGGNFRFNTTSDATKGFFGFDIDPTVKMELPDNTAFRLGCLQISSGDFDAAHLSNNTWFNGTVWSNNLEDRLGSLIQLFGGSLLFYESSSGTGSPSFDKLVDWNATRLEFEKRVDINTTDGIRMKDNKIFMRALGAGDNEYIQYDGSSGIRFNAFADFLWFIESGGTHQLMKLTGDSSVARPRLGIGDTIVGEPDRMLELEDTDILSGNKTDEYVAALRLDPKYQGGFTVTRHNYVECQDPELTVGAVLTDACVFRFDADAGTHKAVDAGSSKSAVGIRNVDAWVKININGVIHYIPSFLDTTS